jgi:hypothetical protein
MLGAPFRVLVTTFPLFSLLHRTSRRVVDAKSAILAREQAGMIFPVAACVDEHERCGQLHLSLDDDVVGASPSIGKPWESNQRIEGIERASSEQDDNEDALLPAPQT